LDNKAINMEKFKRVAQNDPAQRRVCRGMQNTRK